MTDSDYEPTPVPPSESPPLAPLPPLSAEDEKTWAMLAHLSVLLNLITGILGPVAALIIYLIYKDRSRLVAFQAMQAFVFQLIVWVGGGILTALAWGIVSLLVIVVVGICLVPVAILVSFIPLAAVIYGIYAAIQVSQGQPFRYWMIGDWLERNYADKF